MLKNIRVAVAYIPAFMDFAFVNWIVFCWFSLNSIPGPGFNSGQVHKTSFKPLGWKASQDIFHGEKQGDKPKITAIFQASVQLLFSKIPLKESYTAKASIQWGGKCTLSTEVREEWIFLDNNPIYNRNQGPHCIWIFFKE